MDRLDAMEAFVAAVERGSLSSAARALGCSAASVTRAVGSLEERLGVPLLHRTTRALKLTEAGERYLAVCRRVLAEIADAERTASQALRSPRGTLTVTAPVAFGARHVRPVVVDYLTAYPEVQVRLLLLDRVVQVIDEGVDVAVRIAELPDSSLVAVGVGHVRRVVCASPSYLERAGLPAEPAELARHRCVACSGVTPTDTWSFGASQVRVRPALTVNTAEAAVGAAIAGLGLACLLSYQVADAIADGRLRAVLEAFEPPPLPVHLVVPAGSMAAKVRAFVELAAPRLRAALTPSSPRPAGRSSRASRGRSPRA